MNKNTLIIYEHPQALPDVYRWAADKKVRLQSYSDHNGYFTINGEESIALVPVGELDVLSHQGFTKLVLWGSFSKQELLNIIHYMEEDHEKMSRLRS